MKAIYDPILRKMRKVDENTLHKGTFSSLAVLNTTHPTAEAGASADVDTGVGAEVKRYIWDNDDNAWTEQAGDSTQMTDGQVKNAYENNADTNSFTDAEKIKLGNASTELPVVTLGTSGAQTINRAISNKHEITPSGAVTISLAGFTDVNNTDTIRIINGGTNVSWSASIKWDLTDAFILPALQANGYDIIRIVRVASNKYIGEHVGTFDASVATSYDNTGGMGDRIAIIDVVDATALRVDHRPYTERLLAPAYPSLLWDPNVETGTDKGLTFDFGIPKCIQEIRIPYFSGNGGMPPGSFWKWVGSIDNVEWVELLASDSYTWGATVTFPLTTNNEYYRYYRLEGVSGIIADNAYVSQFEFKISE